MIPLWTKLHFQQTRGLISASTSCTLSKIKVFFSLVVNFLNFLRWKRKQLNRNEHDSKNSQNLQGHPAGCPSPALRTCYHTHSSPWCSPTSYPSEVVSHTNPVSLQGQNQHFFFFFFSFFACFIVSKLPLQTAHHKEKYSAVPFASLPSIPEPLFPWVFSWQCLPDP